MVLSSSDVVHDGEYFKFIDLGVCCLPVHSIGDGPSWALHIAKPLDRQVSHTLQLGRGRLLQIDRVELQDSNASEVTR